MIPRYTPVAVKKKLKKNKAVKLKQVVSGFGASAAKSDYI